MKVMFKDGSVEEISILNLIKRLANHEAGGDVEKVQYNSITREFTVTASDGYDAYTYSRVVAQVVEDLPQPFSAEETKHYKTLDALEEAIRYMRILEE